MDDAVAGVQLVTSVLRLVPALKSATKNVNIPGAKGLGGGGTYTTTPTAGVHPAPPRVDPERERRAYETVNYVLRTLGSRIGEAGLVSVPNLSRALTEATMSIDVKLFSTETNRLFESLASKLNDPVLVNSVFSSIYLISFLTAELQGSLPNYKDTYAPLGPRLVQQLFMAAIGQDAFRENQTANLDAYQTLARTAGLLRPTDLERATFPGFPSFRPNRYSSKTFKDTRTNRLAYERLVKHFEIYGFPQPLKGRDVGEIKDWRFLSGDANTRAFEVEKADKHVGENFGRVLHWLICSADRMPPGEAVIAYLDQHIELIKWMGPRMGYRAINAASDINMAGPHAALKKELRDVFNTWVILMPSESAKAKRRQSSAQWAQIQQRPQPSPQASHTSSIQRTPSIGTPVSPVPSNVQPMPNIRHASVSSDHAPMSPTFQPTPLSRRPTNASTTSSVSTPGQPQAPQSTSPPSMPATIPAPQSTTSSLMSKAPISSQSTSPVVSPPPYSSSAAPAAVRPASVVRRKAPPRPKKKLVLAKALDDFEPEDDNDEELPFKEGDILEIVEKSAALEEEGWCRAKLKDSKRIGLAPLEYLEELGIEEQQALEVKPTGVTHGSPPSSIVSPASGLGTVQEIPIQPATHQSTVNDAGAPTSMPVHELPSGSPHLSYFRLMESPHTNPTLSNQTSPALTAHGSPPLNASVPPTTSPSGRPHSTEHGPYSSSQNNMPTTSGTQSSQFAPNIEQYQPQSNSGSTQTSPLPDVYPGSAPAQSSNPTQGNPSTNPSLSISTQNNTSKPSTIQNMSINHEPTSDHKLSGIVKGIAQATLSHQLHTRPSAQATRPSSHGHIASGRPPVQSNQSHQSMTNNISSAIQNAAASNNPASAAGPTMNFSNQTTYSPQGYGATYGGQPPSSYGPAYANSMPLSPYPMAPQPIYGYPPDQSMYNNNNSSNDPMMQMLAMQSLASMTQPSTVISPPATDPSSYNDPSLSTLNGSTTDPGLNLSGTPANSFDGQEEVDNSNTDPTADATANTTTDPTMDINNFSLSPGVDSSSTYIASPAADPSVLVMSNPAADVAAVDPFYAAMNPDLTSQTVVVDPNQGMTSPLASLGPDPSAAGIASLSAGYGADPAVSPLAGLASSPDAGMASPLAGLMPDPNATTSTDLSGTSTTDVTIEDTTIVQQDTTVYDDSGTTTDQQFADDEVDYVMDATACSEDWDAS